MEDFKFTCFVCGTPLVNYNTPCSNCGYIFDDIEEMSICPNKDHGVCSLSENMCMIETNYEECPLKNEIDAEEDLGLS